MKTNDAEIIEKAIELQRLATSDYNNIYNALTGTSASETVLSLLSEELRIAEDVKIFQNSMTNKTEDKSADSQTVKDLIKQLRSS